MMITPNHPNVDPRGVFYLPYLQTWNATSSLLHLVRLMQENFSITPPVRTVNRPPPYQGPGATNPSPMGTNLGGQLGGQIGAGGQIGMGGQIGIGGSQLGGSQIGIGGSQVGGTGTPIGWDQQAAMQQQRLLEQQRQELLRLEQLNQQR